MTTKIIMIVNNEDFLVGSRLLQVEVRRGEPGNTATDDNEVVGRISLLFRLTEPGGWPAPISLLARPCLRSETL